MKYGHTATYPSQTTSPNITCVADNPSLILARFECEGSTPHKVEFLDVSHDVYVGDGQVSLSPMAIVPLNECLSPVVSGLIKR
jgi:hypothetical protein